LAIKSAGVFLKNTVGIAKNVELAMLMFVRIELLLMAQDLEATTLTSKETIDGYLNVLRHFMFQNLPLCYVLEQHYLVLYTITCKLVIMLQ